jgi:P27 family predicted phage terminase small subunit
MSNPPIPFHLAKLRGFPGKRKAYPEPEVPKAAECPAPPGWLSNYAKQEWARVVPDLHGTGLLRAIDTMCLAVYCQNCGRWRQAEERLAEMAERDQVTSGLLIKTQAGDPRINPLIRAARQAAEDMLTAAAQIGLTPVARSRIARGALEQPQGPSKWDGMLA